MTEETAKDLSRAIDTVMRLLAARDHSERELRNKLGRRFESTTIEAAIERVRNDGWLVDPEELAKRIVRELDRRGKSFRYIQGQLRRRGLPSVPKDSSAELTKMRELLRGKFGFSSFLAYEEKTKAYRFLKYRGFDDSLIRKVLNEAEIE